MAPPAGQKAGGSVFVGRRAELEELEEALDEAVGGQGRLFVISGPAGIGKSRLALELAILARVKGARPVWGRCWDGTGAPPCWPWIELARSLVEQPDHATALQADVRRLTALVEEMLHKDATKGTVSMEATDRHRFRFFDAMASVVRRGAQTQPLVLILDDLHLADQASLSCLLFVAKGLSDVPVLVISTWSDGGLATWEQPHELPAALARISRRIALSGLSEDEVAELLDLSDERSSLPTARELHRHTEGHPFFLGEVIEHGAPAVHDNSPGTGAPLLSVPRSVREALIARLQELPDDCRGLLDVAAVIGRDVDLGVLGEVTGRSQTELLADLRPAQSAQIVTLGDQPARCSFSHTLVREAIHENLDRAERARLHGDVATSLEVGAGDRPGGNLGLVAQHLFEAATAESGQARAIESGLRAAAAAGEQLAFEEQARNLDRVLTLVRRQATDPRAPAELLLQLGEAVARSGPSGASRVAFVEAAGIARQLGDAQLLARAALGAGGRFISLGSASVDTELVRLLEEALAALDGAENALRATLLARLSLALFFDADEARRAALSTEALAMARRIGDPSAEIAALQSLYWLRSRPHDLPSRLTIASEILQRAYRTGDQEMALQGHHWRLMALAALGEMAGVDAEISAYRRLAEEIWQPLYQWMATLFRAMRAFMDGRFAAGERLARRAREEGRRAQLAAPFGTIFENQMAWLLYEQGRFGEVMALLPDDLGDEPCDLDTRTRRALLLCLVHRADDLRPEFALLVDQELPRRARVDGYVVVLAQLAQLAHALGDVERATILYPLLKPYAHQQIVIGTAIAMGGSASHHLGLLAATASNLEIAADHFEEALSMNARIGAAPLLARTQFEYARVSLATPSVRRRRSVAALLAEAGGTARRLGMATLLDQVLGLEAAARSDGEAPNVFRREGQFWTISYANTTVRVRDSKGVRYLDHLIRHPGREVHVNDLAAPNGAGIVGTGAGGAIIDAAARSAYKQRLDDLRAEMAEAEGFHDVERANRLQVEIDFLVAELTTAYGVGGAARGWDGPSERARKAVTNRIRAAIRGLSVVHPPLGQHLVQTIRTGTYCAYAKEGPAGWHR
ncbi:MAG: ATP-binding protein [Acidimicrobiales bacterium]